MNAVVKKEKSTWHLKKKKKDQPRKRRKELARQDRRAAWTK